MGMYCCCGVKKRDNFICECDWNKWYLCRKNDKFSPEILVKEHPDKDGIYRVRYFEDSGDDHEEVSRFSINEKNWGQYTNEAVSCWEIEYSDGWTGYRYVYAWKEK